MFVVQFKFSVEWDKLFVVTHKVRITTKSICISFAERYLKKVMHIV